MQLQMLVIHLFSLEFMIWVIMIGRILMAQMSHFKTGLKIFSNLTIRDQMMKNLQIVQFILLNVTIGLTSTVVTKKLFFVNSCRQFTKKVWRWIFSIGSHKFDGFIIILYKHQLRKLLFFVGKIINCLVCLCDHMIFISADMMCLCKPFLIIKNKKIHIIVWSSPKN